MEGGPSREREQIAFGRYIDWEHEGVLGTIFFSADKTSPFPPLPAGTVEELIEAGHLDPEASHNGAPSASELVEWAEQVGAEYAEYQLEIGLIGYMVSPYRSDARTRLTGISIRSPAPIPESLQQKTTRAFDPDLFQVDDFEIMAVWD